MTDNPEAAQVKLSAALVARNIWPKAAEGYAEILLPVVRQIVAEELRAAAGELDTHSDELWRAYKSGPVSDPRRANLHTEGESEGWENAATLLHARADTLDGPTS